MLLEISVFPTSYIFKNHTLSIKTKISKLNAYIYLVLLYGIEAWPITSETRRCLESYEMWFLRGMPRITWTKCLMKKL